MICVFYLSACDIADDESFVVILHREILNQNV